MGVNHFLCHHLCKAIFHKVFESKGDGGRGEWEYLYIYRGGSRLDRSMHVYSMYVYSIRHTLSDVS